MSLFGKILDKLGLRKEQPEVVGTDKVAPLEPPTVEPRIEAKSDGIPAGSAPVSDRGLPGTTSVGDEGKRDAFDQAFARLTMVLPAQINVWTTNYRVIMILSFDGDEH